MEAAARYRQALESLEAELIVLAELFEGLTATDWSTPTMLTPPQQGAEPWSISELASHLDISIGLTNLLIENTCSRPPERDAVSFFVFPSGASSSIYEYAHEMVGDRGFAETSRTLRDTFTRSIRGARAASYDLVGEFLGFEPYPSIRLDDWISTRIVEAVVHGMDVTDAIGRPSIATTTGVSHTATLLEDLLALRWSPGRPDDLTDDIAWIRAASGRDHHSDLRLPLLA